MLNYYGSVLHEYTAARAWMVPIYSTVIAYCTALQVIWQRSVLLEETNITRTPQDRTSRWAPHSGRDI